jgi:deoxyribodipyrimidine photo-lyase
MGSEGPRRSLQPRAELCVMWFRLDLRLDDNPALTAACEAGRGRVLPVYCIDPRDTGVGALGLPKRSARAAQFLIESLTDLRSKLKRVGSDLLVRRGPPEELLLDVAQLYRASQIFTHEAQTPEEEEALRAVEEACVREGVELKVVEGVTLYHRARLPFEGDLSDLPRDFFTFRGAVERSSSPRAPSLAVSKLLPLPLGVSLGKLPSLGDLGHEGVELGKAQGRALGGEAQGLKRVKEYIWEKRLLDHAHRSRRALAGEELSARLASWLNFGCLSPRRLWYEALAFEGRHGQSLGVYQLIYHLMLRDFMIFHARRGGRRLYEGGLFAPLSAPPPAAPEAMGLLMAWREGRTGFPLVDACMRSLGATGELSGQGRALVSRFLTGALGLPWGWGAEVFASLLCDYHPALTWGYFQAGAGVGVWLSDPPPHPVWAGRAVDWGGEFVRAWVPELARLPPEVIYEPYVLDEAWQVHLQFQLGVDYPYPVVPPSPLVPAFGERGVAVRLMERVLRRFPGG